jgi:FAD:protein FMN transferase
VSWDRDVFSTMGTVASLTVESVGDTVVDVTAVHDVFDHYDALYSLYKPESELAQISVGRLALQDASDELRETYALALEWRAATHGEFSPHRPDGVIDLSGVVKALAIQDAGRTLTQSGAHNWCLNVGGDVLVSGLGGAHAPWSVGIVDPLDRGELITSAVLQGSRHACATSGSAERGDHIWTVGAAPTVFLQATVVANDIVTADVLATAIIAGGPGTLDQICATWDIDAMTVDHEGELRMTPGFAFPESSHR